jgi:uncharacterized protein
VRLVVLSRAYALERVDAIPDAWHALIRAPDGLTVVRDAHDGDEERWAALWDADAGHGLDVPGLLASVIDPLAGAGIPVFVSSTFTADVVLVPLARLDAAAGALRAAGHDVALD